MRLVLIALAGGLLGLCNYVVGYIIGARAYRRKERHRPDRSVTPPGRERLP